MIHNIIERLERIEKKIDSKSLNRFSTHRFEAEKISLGKILHPDGTVISPVEPRLKLSQ